MRVQIVCSPKLLLAFTACKWFFSCVFSHLMWQSTALLNSFTHSLHANGFSPVCILIRRAKLPASPNCPLHSLHVNRFSPVCFLIRQCKCSAIRKCFLHSRHAND